MIRKIISGGQTGGDQAALDVAIHLGLSHGGWIPKGRMTLKGPLPNRYRLRELASTSHQRRTEQNVVDSDGTLIFSHGPLASGFLYARKMAKRHKRPWLHVDLDNADLKRSAVRAGSWICDHRIGVLNVAGPHTCDPLTYGAISFILRGAVAFNQVKSEGRRRMDTQGKEHRSASRLPFSTDEGLIGVVIRPESGNEIVAATMLNISRGGVRISAKRGRTKAYALGESLVLTAFKGTADVRFNEPIGLEIRWVDDRPASQSVQMGCEMVYVSTAARKVLDDFLEKEMKWKGMPLQQEPRTAPEAPAAPAAVAGPPDSSTEALPAPGSRGRSRLGWGVAAGAVAVLLLAFAILRVEQTGRALNGRLDTLEARLVELQEKKSAADGSEKNIRSLGEQVDILANALDETKGRETAFEERFDDLSRQVESLAEAMPREILPPPASEMQPAQAGPEAASTIHKVQRGENLFRISLRYKTTVEALCRLNNILPGQMLYAGQKLKVPVYAVGGSPLPESAGETTAPPPDGPRQDVAKRAP